MADLPQENHPLFNYFWDMLREMGYTHELALLTSTFNQEKMANELLAGLAQGKGPLKKLIEKTSLKRVGAALR